MSTERENAFVNTAITKFCLILSLNFAYNNQNQSFFLIEGSEAISSKLTV